jgi:hypothetical protein
MHLACVHSPCKRPQQTKPRQASLLSLALLRARLAALADGVGQLVGGHGV